MSSRIYTLKYDITYKSKRYDKVVSVPKGYKSDGATGAIDIASEAWWVHDKLCDTGLFDDGTLCSNKKASTILSDILRKEGRKYRAFYWHWSTLWFGGGKCRGQ